MKHIWHQLINPPDPGNRMDELTDRWKVRNATCLIGAASSVMGVIVFAIIGQAKLYIPAGLVGLGFLVAFLCSWRGARRIACLLAVVPLELALLYNTHNFGPGLFESAYLMCVCIAYLLLEGEDGSVLFFVIAFTTALVCIGSFAWDDPPIPLSRQERHMLLAATVCLTLFNMATVLFYFLGTRRRSSERLRAALAAANAANAAKSEFLASMSHEIRTPMNGVIGMLSLLEHTELDPVQRDYLDTAQLSSRALIDIINDILDLSKIEARALSLAREPFDLRTLVENAARLTAVQTRASHVDVVVHYPPDVPAHLFGDPGRIRQILGNLLGNALKFTERGHILVTARCLASDAGRATLELSVTDTGIGIPEAEQQAIFDKFKQIEHDAWRGHGGTGLGLPIVQELLTLMGGTIAVASTPGEGSSFSCRLELDLDAHGPSDPHGPHGPEDEPLRALLVDADELRIQSLAPWLAHHRVDIDQCGDADEARTRLARADGHGYDLVFLDPTRAPGRELALPRDGDRDGHPPANPHIVAIVHVASNRDATCLQVVHEELTLPLRHAELARLLARLRQVELPVDDARVDSSTDWQSWPDGLRVLVVDDNPINQKVARRLLENLDCQVDVAASGREALESVGRNSYELVFMDLEMPEMDGLETTASLRRSARAGELQPRLPIVAMTAHAMAENRAECLAAGMDGFVSKPVEKGDLVAVLKRFSDRLTGNRETVSRKDSPAGFPM